MYPLRHRSIDSQWHGVKWVESNINGMWVLILMNNINIGINLPRCLEAAALQSVRLVMHALTQRYEECIKMNKKNRSVLRKQELEQDVSIWVGQCFGQHWPIASDSTKTSWKHASQHVTYISTSLNIVQQLLALGRQGDASWIGSIYGSLQLGRGSDARCKYECWTLEFDGVI
jgi:hypothetical protein